MLMVWCEVLPHIVPYPEWKFLQSWAWCDDESMKWVFEKYDDTLLIILSYFIKICYI